MEHLPEPTLEEFIDTIMERIIDWQEKNKEKVEDLIEE